MAHCQADEAHSEQVARLALQIFDATQPIHRASIDERRTLEFAGLLHDIGHFIDGNDHHKHGQYLIRHSRMPGFTAPEVNLLGNIVRYHRAGRPKPRDPDFQALPPADRVIARRLASILRLADAFDRGHDQNVVSFQVRLDGRTLSLDARVRAEGELEHWAAVQRADALAEELGVEILIRVERA
jgi:exopolyphosphatase/guanosine-5'-triphosphate,3'-diphosphate pyrophosphatase